MEDARFAVEMNGMKFQNPFLLGSGPPGTNAKVIAKSFDLGWGGMVIKTISLDSEKVVNVSPRYTKIKSSKSGDIISMQNIELISDRPFQTWLEEIAQLKDSYPDRVLIASIAEEPNKDAWQEIVQRVQEAGADGFELNLSCPHGMPERRMGMAMGEDPELVEQICSWVTEVSRIPVWAKMTPNVGDVRLPAQAAVRGGADGIAMINTVLSVTGVNLQTLKPLPTVEDYSIPGGLSGEAVKPIALRQVMEVARAMPDTPISGMGGIARGNDAIEFMLLGARTVQVCTSAMLQGYGLIEKLKDELARFMDAHEFNSLHDFIGASLPYFSSHGDLVQRQAAAKAAKRAGTNLDAQTWKGDIASETNSLISG